MQPITQQILATTDYGIFKRITGNRTVGRTHVKRLIKSIEKHGNLTPHNPVEVNSDMEVIDGQHRIAALKELGLPVYYTVQDSATQEDMHIHNMFRSNWTTVDYIRSYAERGNQNYVRLLKLLSIFPSVQYTTLINVMLLSNTKEHERIRGSDGKFTGKPGIGIHTNRTSFLRSGEFIFTEQDLVENIAMLDKVIEAYLVINDSLGTQRRGRQYIIMLALRRVMASEHYDHDRMIKKLTDYGAQLKLFAAVDDWMRQLEDVYNYKSRETNQVRLY